MGITIDDVELWAKQNNFTIVADKWWENAQDIICKYQKIKEQVDIAIDKENFAISGARLIQIREIINGNDN